MSGMDPQDEGMVCDDCGVTEAEADGVAGEDPEFCPHGEPHDWRAP